MLGRERELPTQMGNEYRNIHVEGGNCIIGNVYSGELARDCNVGRNTDCNLGLIVRSTVY